MKPVLPMARRRSEANKCLMQPAQWNYEEKTSVDFVVLQWCHGRLWAVNLVAIVMVTAFGEIPIPFQSFVEISIFEIQHETKTRS